MWAAAKTRRKVYTDALTDAEDSDRDPRLGDGEKRAAFEKLRQGVPSPASPSFFLDFNCAALAA